MSFSRLRLVSGLTLLVVSGCGGAPANTGTKLVDVMARTDGPRPAPQVASDGAVTASPPAGLFAQIRFENADSMSRLLAGWVNGAAPAVAHTIARETKLSKLPEASVAVDRPLVFLLQKSGKHADELTAVSIRDRDAVLAQYTKTVSVKPGVVELWDGKSEDDDYTPDDVKEADSDAVNSSTDASNVCWLGAAGAPMGDLLLCGKKRSVAVTFDYVSRTLAAQSTDSDVHLDVYGREIAGSVLPELQQEILKDLAQDEHTQRPFVMWLRKQAPELIKAAHDFDGISVDMKFDWAKASADLVVRFGSKDSIFTKLLLSGSSARAAPPEQVFRMPADASELVIRQGGSAEAWAPVVNFFKEGLVGLGDSGWQKDDLARLTSIAERFARFAASTSVIASGVDLERLAKLTPAAPANLAGGMRGPTGPQAASEIDAKYTISYSDMAFEDTKALLEDTGKLVTGPGARKAVTAGLHQFDRDFMRDILSSTTISFAAKPQVPAGLPPKSVHYEGQVSFKSEVDPLMAPSPPSGGRTRIPVKARMSTVTKKMTCILIPLGTGTLTVSAADETLALAKARVVVNGTDGTLATRPTAAVLRNIRAAGAWVLTPRTVANFAYGMRSWRAPTASPTRRNAAISSPEAFVPLVIEWNVVPAAAAAVAGAGGQVELQGRLARESVSTLADWFKNGILE